MLLKKLAEAEAAVETVETMLLDFPILGRFMRVFLVLGRLSWVRGHSLSDM